MTSTRSHVPRESRHAHSDPVLAGSTTITQVGAGRLGVFTFTTTLALWLLSPRALYPTLVISYVPFGTFVVCHAAVNPTREAFQLQSWRRDTNLR